MGRKLARWSVAASLVTAVACGPTPPPPRPGAVPRAAVWVGGPEGGVFILCRADMEQSVLYCAVYNDFSGRTLSEGAFVEANSGQFTSVNEADFVTWDGRGIALTRGRRLIRVASVPVPFADERRDTLPGR